VQHNIVQKIEKMLVILITKSEYMKKDFMFHTLYPVIGDILCVLS